LERPAVADMPKDSLPPPTGRVDHGYNGYYTTRDPSALPEGVGQWNMKRKRAGKDEWERAPVAIDDPDGAVMSFDPPDKAYATMHWAWLMQLVELPDASLLAVFYGYRLDADRRPHPKWQSYCLRSVDNGLTWRFRGIIGPDDNPPLAGYTEPSVTLLRDGSLLAALRTECARMGPMYRTRSTDGGETWEKPEPMYPFGVLPKLLALQNGVTALSFGRPGAHMLFSQDGEGRSWENLITFVAESLEGTGIEGEGHGFQRGEDPGGRPKQTRTSGYTDLVAIGPAGLMIVYDQFDYPDENCEPRKTILVKRITVSA
ncbi:sialidase family protein, partial [Verrucomicrobiota bacterium]